MGDPNCIDPQQENTIFGLNVTRQVVDSLTAQDGATGKITPWLAKSWKVNADSTSFTFMLRDGVTFSDGTALTAQVVKDNFEAIERLGAKALNAGPFLVGLTGVTVNGPKEFTVSFDKPNVPFLQATSTEALGITSEATTKKTAAERCTDGVIGSGPFINKSYKPNANTVLTRRDGYNWGAPTWKSQGPAHLSQVTFQVLPSNGGRVGALQSGQIDVADQVPAQNATALKSSGSLVPSVSPGIAASLIFNEARMIPTDASVREAISFAIDRSAIVATLQPAASPAKGILSENTLGFSDASKNMVHDQAKAESILDAAGWKVGANGIREKNGTPLKLTFANFNPPAAATLIQAQLKSIGIQVDVRQITTEQVVPTWTKGDFDMMYQYNTRNEPDVLRTLFGASGGNNYRIKDSSLDALLQKQTTESNTSQRMATIDQIQTIILQKAYAVPLYQNISLWAISNKVHNYALDGSSRPILHDVTLD